MTDLETRLSAALRGAADEAPTGHRMADGARTRLRRRRRTRTGMVAAAVVVLLAAPLAVLIRPAPKPEPAAATDGWRVETYGDLTLRVPPEWGYDGGTDWCAGDGRPAVTRGEGDVIATNCDPRLPYGVMFRDGPDFLGARPQGLPPGAAVGLAATDSQHAWIVAENEQQLALIQGTVQTVEGSDPNGCPVTVDPESTGAGERVSVCRYESGHLQQSELLSVAESEKLATALARTQAAPTTEPYLACPPYSLRQPVITLRSGSVRADLLPSQGCSLAGVMLVDGQQALLTENVLFWALSPGSQLFPSEGLPMPDPLRD